MKYKLLLLIIIGTSLSSCVFSDSQKIKTKEETINALIGSWKPKNSSSNTSSITFIDKTHYVVFYHVKDGDLAELNGTWSCEDVGYPKSGPIKSRISSRSEARRLIEIL